MLFKIEDKYSAPIQAQFGVSVIILHLIKAVNRCNFVPDGGPELLYNPYFLTNLSVVSHDQ